LICAGDRRSLFGTQCGRTARTALGPPLLPRILNAENYAELLLHNLEDLLDNVPLQHLPQWFQHDGAPAHFARNVRDILHHMYPNQWIGRGGPIHWPARSPDLTPLDFFLWGHMQNYIYSEPIATLEELDGKMVKAIATITPEMLQNTRSLIRRANFCIEMHGGHFEQLL
jgi:hypothetical protein